MLTPPKAVIGAMVAIDCEKLMQANPLLIKYLKTIDLVSAFKD